MSKNQVCELLKIRYPIIQGAMTNVTDVGLVSAVSNAGGLGIYAPGIENIDLEYVRKQIRLIRAATPNSFGVNIMLASAFAAQLVDLVCEEKVPVVTTGAGNPAPYMAQFKQAGITVVPVVPSKEAAVKMQAIGVEMVIAEGMESGGYIGRISTMTLIPQVVDAVKIPVIAAGGIADGRGMAAVFMLGAQGIQMGTRFLTTKECAIPEHCKAALLNAQSKDAVVLGERIGVAARLRVLRTPITEEIQAYESQKDASDAVFNKSVADARGNPYEGGLDKVLLGTGQIVALVNDTDSVKTVIERISMQFNAIQEVPI
ncbi:MAG: nitronate monooxygenase family protein [Firmicutes bacterium]|nr:nitronate monooxygenase family protein [Bacillota bacterium]